MLNNKKIIEEFRKIRTNAISEMFDNVDKNGIYPTSKFFAVLDKALEQALSNQKEKLFNEMIAEIFIRKDGILPLRDVWIKPDEIQKIRKTLKKTIEKLDK